MRIISLKRLASCAAAGCTVLLPLLATAAEDTAKIEEVVVKSCTTS
jgi:hypothetical protein